MKAKPAEPTKPRMPRKDASFHIASAGARAMREAEQQGTPPEAIESLMESTEPLQVGDLTLRRLSLPVVWALEKVGSAYMRDTAAPAEPATGAEASQIEMADIAVAIACFADPIGMHTMARTASRQEIVDHAMTLCDNVSMDEMRQANDWFNAQFARVAAMTGADIQAPKQEQKKRPGARP